jgi:dihydroxyacetone kinase-like protein
MTKASIDDVDLVLKTMATTIVDNAEYFAQLDSIVGDGDFGYSLRNGFEVVLSDWDSLDRSGSIPFSVMGQAAEGQGRSAAAKRSDQ